MSLGTLYLIPVPLGATAPEAVLAAPVLHCIRPLSHFVVENAKSARAFLKTVGTEQPLQALQLEELNEHTPDSELTRLLAPLKAGADVGLISEAGCPAVADPAPISSHWRNGKAFVSYHWSALPHSCWR